MTAHDFATKTCSSKAHPAGIDPPPRDLPDGTLVESRLPDGVRARGRWAFSWGLVVVALTIVAPASAEEPGDSLISRAHAAAQARGASARDPLKAQQATLGGQKVLNLQFELKANACLVAAAATNESVNDAEVSLKAPGADWIADTTPGPVATLRYCAGKVAERVQLRARVPGQDAPVALGAWPMRTADEPAATDRSRDENSKVTSSTLRRELAKLAARDAATLEPAAPAREEDLGPLDPRTREVSLEAGRCYRFLAVTGAPTARMTLRLRDPAGKDVASHASEAATIALPKDKPYCSSTTATHQLAVELGGGEGVVLWQPFGGADPARAQRFAIGGEGKGALAQRVRDAHAALPEGSAAALAFATGTLATAQRAEASFSVQPGACYVATVAGAPSLRSLDLEIVDQRDSVIAEARDQGNVATARACASIPGQWRVRARAFKGYGEYGMQVFVSP